MTYLLRIALSILIVVSGIATDTSLAQGYPSKPVRIVVPFAAGGAVDTLARLVGPRMADALGQPVLVDNRPGANTTIGSDVVAKAAPDGHTILLVPISLAISPAIYRKLPFDPGKDLAAVSQLVATTMVLVASPKLPVNSIGEMIALARSKPGSLNYGYSGVLIYLTMEQLKISAGIDVLAVPYKGDAPLNTALIAGEVELSVVPLSTSLQSIRAGRLRALGVPEARRSASLPEVPTVSETAVPGFVFSSWLGMFVPANTPRGIVEQIQREAVSAIHVPEVRSRIEAMGQELVGSTPKEFDATWRADLAKFARIVKEARIPLQD